VQSLIGSPVGCYPGPVKLIATLLETSDIRHGTDGTLIDAGNLFSRQSLISPVVLTSRRERKGAVSIHAVFL
jgi:hypothetical protein